MASGSLPNTSITNDLANSSHKPDRDSNEDSLPDFVASAVEIPNNGYQHPGNSNALHSPIAVPVAAATANHRQTPSAQQSDGQTLSLLRNLENRFNILHDDLRHLEKRCKFYEKKSKMYEKRQKKLEKAVFKKKQNLGGDGDNEGNDFEDESVDEEAMEDFYAEGDGGDKTDWSNDEAVSADDGNHGSNEKKKSRKRKRSNDTEPKIYSDAVIFPPNTLDFSSMFEKLRVYHQLYGTCSVTSAYGDKSLKKWVRTWKERRRRFDKMVEEEGGQEAVFPGLDDIDAKTYTKDAIPEYSHQWEDQQVQHLESKRYQLNRRFMLRTRHQIKCLNTLDFNWNITEIPRFEDRLIELQDFISEHGHYNIPREYGGIGEWFHKMKGNFVFRRKHFMEKQYPMLLEMGVDMNVAVQGRRRRRRKNKNDVNNNNECRTEEFEEGDTGDMGEEANVE
ncbi:hypothetical protein ACHAXS_002213 [Conticribra weissflogii]